MNIIKNLYPLTLGTGDDRTALVWLLLDGTILTDSLRERANPEVTHEHPVVTSTVQARFVC